MVEPKDEFMRLGSTRRRTPKPPATKRCTLKTEARDHMLQWFVQFTIPADAAFLNRFSEQRLLLPPLLMSCFTRDSDAPAAGGVTLVKAEVTAALGSAMAGLEQEMKAGEGDSEGEQEKKTVSVNLSGHTLGVDGEAEKVVADEEPTTLPQGDHEDKMAAALQDKPAGFSVESFVKNAFGLDA